MILLIDNYDSFSYNLFQLVGSLDPDIKVIRNDAMTTGQIEELSPKAIILSPGPGNRRMPVSVLKSLKSWAAGFPFWASVWDIRQSALPTEEPFPMPKS